MQSHDTTQDIPYGYCQCGCGQKTKISTKNSTRDGYVKGEPRQFISGHNARKYPVPDLPNPSGLCACGCGQPTWIATKTSLKHGWVKGQPARLIRGHGQTRPLAERFWEKVDKRGPDECWPWLGGHTKTGRGVIRDVVNSPRGKEKIVASHVSWQLHVGPVPDDMYVLHKCDNPACVNPNHLFLGTQSDNMIDMRKKGRGPKSTRK